ncbi:unnamed protein product [Rhizophagus irregularis]|nr:unnamed protein product [Rhizophagus irregularis]
MPKETPRKRKSLTSAQKKEVCLKKISTSFLKQKDLVKEYNVSEGMFPIIEEALTVWIDKALQAGFILTESILTTKTLDFALLCNKEKFKASTFGNFNEYGTELGEIDIKKCIKYIAHAWDNITNDTIKNCWIKAGIIPEYGLEEVQVLINKLDFEDSFTAEEFVLYDDSEVTAEMISDDEILKAVQPNNPEKEEIEEEPLPTITHNEVIECYDKVILYLQRQENNYSSNDEEIKFIKN